MAFDIRLSEETPSHLKRGERACYGEILIGDLRERFVAPLSYWNPIAYEEHWRDAITRLLEGAPASCLITSMPDPSSANFITWWPAYRVGDEVRVQNHVLFMDDLAEPFDVSDPYRFVPERETEGDDGEPVSEWAVHLSDLQDFIRKTAS